MTNQEILHKAIEKAITGGYKPFGNEDENIPDMIIGSLCQNANWSGIWCYEIIFSHAFAKTFWGEEEYVLAIYPLGEDDDASAIWHSPEEWKEAQEEDERITEALVDDDMPAWKWHLQRMVITEEPLKYIEQFI